MLTKRIIPCLDVIDGRGGGAGNIDHMVEVLDKGKVDDVKQYLGDHGVPVRPVVVSE